MPATALDIGTYAIKALTGNPGDEPKIERSAMMRNPLGIAYPTDDSQAEKLMNLLDAFINDNKLSKNDVRLSLPEDAVSTKLIELPSLSDAELASAIDWQAEQHIPIPQDNLTLEYRVLFRPSKREKDRPMRVLLVGTKTDLVERYTNVFLNLGIQPKVMETQSFSIIRALNFEPTDPTSLIAHLGANQMQLSIVADNELKLSISHQGGGALLTRVLSQSIENLNQEQAEQYKIAYGIKTDQLQGKISQILMPSVESFTSQIVKTIRYYNNQNNQQAISRIVLSGGAAQLPGLIEHLSNNSELEVLIAAPFASAKGNIPEDNQQAYIVCAGLLMRKA